MTMEWFHRVTSELDDHLTSICDKYDQVGHMTIDQSAKHPRIEFFVETDDDDREIFSTLFFDPHNEEFYVESFDLELEQPARVILTDIQDVIDAVHEHLHDFMDDDNETYYVDELDDDDEYILEDGEEYYVGEVIEEGNVLEKIGIEWETPEVTAFQIEDEVEITYQFGVVSTTGEGVLRRVNRLWVDDEDLYKDESIFTFSKEEASTIIAMIASHMDTLPAFEDIINQ
ncbi:MAG: hypothetical protein ACE3JQ_12270 [Paenisporosarcina sp.]